MSHTAQAFEEKLVAWLHAHSFDRARDDSTFAGYYLACCKWLGLGVNDDMREAAACALGSTDGVEDGAGRIVGTIYHACVSCWSH